VSATLFFALCGLGLAVRAVVGRWRLVAIALTVWALVVAIVALAGGFHATGEDNSSGIFVFTAVPTLSWIVCMAAGVVSRRIATKLRA
jgi:hypothetical protein